MRPTGDSPPVDTSSPSPAAKDNASFEEIADVLRTRTSFLVLSHHRPDGDAIGSQLAMAHCLDRLGKQVAVWNQDPVPSKMAFLPGAERMTPPPDVPQNFDCVLALDTSDRQRLGSCPDAVGSAEVWINIDHHPTNDRFADLNLIVPDAPSTGEILYELIRSQELPFSYEVADCLYVAIATDTGSFQYPSTTARTHEIAAELVRAGVDVGAISQGLYQSYPLRRIELLGSLLNSLELFAGNRLAIVSLPLAEARRIGSKPEDAEGLIDQIRAIDTVVAAAFIEETAQGEIRASLRSKSRALDVGRLCQSLGGGGHALAAGVRLDPPLVEAKARIVRALEDALAAMPDDRQ